MCGTLHCVFIVLFEGFVSSLVFSLVPRPLFFFLCGRKKGCPRIQVTSEWSRPRD